MTQHSSIRRKIVGTAASFLVLATFFLSGCAGPRTAVPGPSPPAFATTPAPDAQGQAPAMQNTPVPAIAPSAAPDLTPPPGWSVYGACGRASASITERSRILLAKIDGSSDLCYAILEQGLRGHCCVSE